MGAAPRYVLCGSEEQHVSGYNNRNDHHERRCAVHHLVSASHKTFIVGMSTLKSRSIFCRYDMPDSWANGTQYCNFAFTVYFVLEMVIKLMGLGPRAYVSDNFNIFDAVVTLLGVLDMALTLAPNVSSPASLTVFRAFRLLRVLRLARSWKGLNRIVKVLFSSLASVGWLTVLLFLFLFITGLLGMAVGSSAACYLFWEFKLNIFLPFLLFSAVF